MIYTRGIQIDEISHSQSALEAADTIHRGANNFTVDFYECDPVEISVGGITRRLCV